MSGGRSGWQEKAPAPFDPFPGHEHFVFVTSSVPLASLHALRRTTGGAVYRVAPDELTFLPGILPAFRKVRSEIRVVELSDFDLARRCRADFVFTSAEILEVLA